MEKPRVVVVGCGYWGQNLVRNFAKTGTLAAVCDATEAGRKRAAELAPQVRIVDDFGDALDLADAVVIATPAETHYEVAIRALRAGKDVFVEKPMALHQDQARELVKLADEKSRILLVGHVLEYHPAIRRIRELIAEGKLGKVKYIYSNRLNLGKIRREENILWSFAPHDIAVILRLMGAFPFEVVACGGTYVQPNIADVTVTHLLFDNGVRAHVFVSWLHPFKEQRLVVVGSQAMVSFDDVSKKLILHDQRVEVREGMPVPVKGDGTELQFSAEEPLLLECNAFLDAVRTRQAPLTDGRSGLRTLMVLQAAQRSLVTNGQPVLMNETGGW